MLPVAMRTSINQQFDKLVTVCGKKKMLKMSTEKYPATLIYALGTSVHGFLSEASWRLRL